MKSITYSLAGSRALTGFLAFVTLLALTGQPARSDQPAASPHYDSVSPSRDGIGKIYLGREISQVMGHLGASWLERPQRVQEERTDLLLAALALQPADIVVDLGAGTGYFSFPMAAQVPQGRVLAVDIQPEMLAIIEQRIEQDSVGNIEPVLAQECDPTLTGREIDVVLLVDAYHEFSCPREVMLGVVAALSPQGRVMLVEYRGEDPSIGIKPLHTMTLEQATKEMAAVGLELTSVSSVLPKQHLMTFKKLLLPLTVE
ncbi:MAG: class I SAM-dependent methyltransferase [Halioglobus sp.]